jgi:outer membrane receptor for ferrienterochelin and colicins
LPGIFAQDEISFNQQHKLLVGLRYDYNSAHGNIFTPRIAYKYTINNQQFLRLNIGTGFRVVNLFTEDHAALSGARKVVLTEQLKPEQSFNINLNYIHKIYGKGSAATTLDFSAFYTYFNNRIVGDFETDPNQIIYSNLNGHAISKGVSANADIALNNGIKLNIGATYMDVALHNNQQKEQQILTERFSGTWSLSYRIPSIHLDIDYTGNVYSPMRLPLLGPLDPRQPYSPWYSLQNVQFTFHYWHGFELYGGVKNLLNFLPTRYSPFLIARANDPFDKSVQFQPDGQVQSTPDNPYALSFDPTYMFAPNQGIRGFLGIRYTIK